MLWQKKNNTQSHQIEAKAAHTIERIKDKLFLYGGWNGRSALDSLEVYNITKEEWSSVTIIENKPQMRNNHASCVVNDYIYIHGGHDGEIWLDDFFRIDTKKMQYEIIIVNQNLTNKPKPRACHTLSYLNKKIYLFGGYDGKESYSNMEIYDLQTCTWTTITSTEDIKPRNAHSALVYNKKIYIYGGHFKNFHLNDLIIFDTIYNTWTIPNLKGQIPIGIRGHSANLIFNKIYIFGGYDGKSRSNDIYRLTLDDFSFTKINTNKEIVLPRQRHTGTVINNFKILYFGGFDGSKWLNCIDILDISLLEKQIHSQNSNFNLKSDFKSLINNSEFSDLIFQFEENSYQIFAHKFILSNRCEYFKNMFSDYMIERNSDVIPIYNFSYNVFYLFLEFVYTSEINFNKDLFLLIKLYELADAYSFESLKVYCEDFLQISIDLDNAIEILILAYKCSSNIMENLALVFISKNRKEIYNSDKIHILDDFPQLMLKILNFL